MKKSEIITSAGTYGIEVTENTYGIFNPTPVYSIRPKDELKRRYMQNGYHVTMDRSRPELLSGIRIMAERMGVKLPSTFNR